jgi:hypothetical protein
VSLFDCAISLFAVQVKFLSVIMAHAQAFGIDWAHSMVGSAVISMESHLILRVIGTKVAFGVEFVQP